MKRELLATAALLALACPVAAQVPEPAPPPVVAPGETPPVPPQDEAAKTDEAKWDVQNPPGPSRDISIDVIDVDLAVNDPVGSGTCARGRTCRLGQATVSIH